MGILITIEPGASSDWLTPSLALVAAIIGLYQYRRAQLWKRSEWVLDEVKEFLEDPYVLNALLMLDWRDRDLPLLQPGNGTSKRFGYNAKMLVHALSSHSSPQKHNYTHEEISIRDSFDRLLAGLDRFDTFIARRLVSKKDLAPYLEYWIDIIGNRRNTQQDQHVRDRLWGYILDYEFTGVQQLLKRFGYNVLQKD